MMRSKWLRIKYSICVAFLPSYWLQNHKLDKDWDARLWKALIEGDTGYIGSCTAIIGDEHVWIANHPYASGTYRFGQNGIRRSTAMLLHKSLPTARIMSVLKYGTLEYYRSEQGHIII